MIDIHPTETGRDGEFFRRYATPKPGDPKEDKINCAQCGFPFRLDVDVKGDSEDSPGITQETETVAVANVQAKLPVHLQGLTAFSVTSKDITIPTVNSGCRLCGTYNPTGKESKEFDTAFKDMSGR